MQIEVIVEDVPCSDEPGGGLHLMGEWHECQGPRLLLESLSHVRAACLAAANEANLTVVGDHFYPLPDGGVTGTVLLAESHLAIRTWPPEAQVALDVFVCNRTHDNRAKARAVFELVRRAYRPRREEMVQVRRGGLAAAV
jgi:S-adenosylmethionine decarboxylase proenzyme